MRNLVLYTIVFIFSIAFCYETIDYCYQEMSSRSFCEHHDLDCEESKTGSEKSGEKSEKTDFFDEITLDKDHLALMTSIRQQVIKSHIHFFTCDYSKIVYSPPEPPLI